MEPKVKAAMEGYLSESMTDNDGARRSADLQAQLLVTYLEREFTAEADPPLSAQRRQLLELWEAVDGHLRHPWSVALLAQRIHVSPVTLYRMCASHGEAKPMAMVCRLRMHRASTWLRETEEPIKRISAWVGYGNGFAFSTAFKRFGGLSPAAFRQQCRERSKT